MVVKRQLSYGRTMRDLDTVSIAGVAILVTKSHRNQLNLLPESLGFLLKGKRKIKSILD
jgi:hypothetical protein